jgi:hypothetical protein
MALVQSAFSERERWVFDNDGVIVVHDAISPCARFLLFSKSKRMAPVCL